MLTSFAEDEALFSAIMAGTARLRVEADAWGRILSTGCAESVEVSRSSTPR